MADPSSRAGKGYIDQGILEHVSRVHAPHDPGLRAAFGASASAGLPAIQVGPSEGKLLQLLVRLCNAERVIEVGTLGGYSAIWMARGMVTGMIHSIEISPHHAEVARANIREAGLSDRVCVHVGEALKVLPDLEQQGPFDLVFIDADKGNYDAYGRWAAIHLRPGGLLVGDNAFLFGRLLNEGDEPEAMRRFHEEAARAFESVCVPTPDGMVVGIRRDSPED